MYFSFFGFVYCKSNNCFIFFPFILHANSAKYMLNLYLILHITFQARNYIASLPKKKKRPFKEVFVNANPLGE